MINAKMNTEICPWGDENDENAKCCNHRQSMDAKSNIASLPTRMKMQKKVRIFTCNQSAKSANKSQNDKKKVSVFATLTKSSTHLHDPRNKRELKEKQMVCYQRFGLQFKFQPHKTNKTAINDWDSKKMPKSRAKTPRPMSAIKVRNARLVMQQPTFFKRDEIGEVFLNQKMGFVL